MDAYRSYCNLPPLAGITTLEEAMTPGYSVETCVRRLKRYHYGFKRLHEILIARLTAEPIYELKMAFSHQAYLCSEHTSALRQRVGEMREPPLGLETVPHQSLALFFDEIRSAPSIEALLLGLYEKAFPAMKQSLERHLEETNRLTDAPSVRLCRFALLELDDILQFGHRAIDQLVDSGLRTQHRPWLERLDECLQAAGNLDGSGETDATPPSRWHSTETPHYDSCPQRDTRFDDPYNMGVNAEVFLYDNQYPASAKTLMLFYKRLREIDVPEMMASILMETTGKSWSYYRDMTRQLWDEARHAMMGEVGFVQAGVDWTKVKVNFTWSLALNTQLSPIERHAVLYFIEQGLMPKRGKRYEWEVAKAADNVLAERFQDYDWADEVLHAKIGRDWYLKEFSGVQEAVRYGDRCWSQVLMDWAKWQENGLTEHRNWWPEVYREACARWGIDPDPQALSFNTTYEQVRADLKEITGSA